MFELAAKRHHPIVRKSHKKGKPAGTFSKTVSE